MKNKIVSNSKTLRVCKKGHRYYKSSDCPTCPECEKSKKPQSEFLSLLAAPARRALENNQITTLKKLASFTEKEIFAFHGMGKASIPQLKKLLADNKLNFKKK